MTSVTSPHAACEPLVSHGRAVAALTVVGVGAFCFITSETLPSGMLTLISSSFGTPLSTTGQLVTAYALVVVIFSVPLTIVTARVARRGLLAGTLGVFGLASLMTFIAPTFNMVVAARLAAGLAHALFWSIAVAAVAGLFPTHIRGRMVARLSLGSALGPVLGVPLGTWLGQQTDWRMPFVALAAVSLTLGATLFFTLPSYRPEQGGASRGAYPSMGRFMLLLVVTVLAVTGALGVITYMAPYLLNHVGISQEWLSVVLGLSGVAGIVGTMTVGRFLDSSPLQALLVALGGFATADLLLWLCGGQVWLVLGAVAIHGACFGALAAILLNRGLQVAPGNTDIAVSSVSTAFNVGIAGGAFFGGQVLDYWSLNTVPLMGALAVTGAALLTALERQFIRGGSQKVRLITAQSRSHIRA